MNNGDKILSSIKSDCDKIISVINADSAKVCDDILAKGRADAENAVKEVNAKAQKKAAQMRAASKSRAELEKRNTLLKKRREEIDITLDAIYNYLINLDGEKYFNIIYKLCSKLSGKQGEMLFNIKDLKRLPKDFEAKLAKTGLNAKVSKNTADITGGFILKCGDIEENMSFSSMLSDKREQIEDLINRELFAE
ncbi:MAG: V-type ATP synthase subunit E [Ruminococcus sp.]|nr:V-type ATP synthase subunit E [Ruminococcus sp.]